VVIAGGREGGSGGVWVRLFGGLWLFQLCKRLPVCMPVAKIDVETLVLSAQSMTS